MWRRHRSDPSAQYWLGAVRDTKDANNWKWLNGRDVTVSFWNLPGGRGNCARFDGAKGWLWSDTNCNDQLNFICQHGPRGCGRPEQPPNSTLLATSLDVGARIEHRCDAGHLLVGPATRTCLPNGFYSEFPPVCRFLECGPPAQVPNGHYTLINGTRGYQSMVRYSCEEGHVMVGRSDLMCDIDQKWNGPPPRCEPLVCPDPPQILNGYYNIEADTGENLYVVNYECDPEYTLVGPKAIVCSEGVYDQPPPVCREADAKRPMASNKVPASAAARPSAAHNSSIITSTTFKSTSTATSNNKPNLIAQPGYGHEQEPAEETVPAAAEEEEEEEDRYDPNVPHETPQYEDEHYSDGDLGYSPDNGLDNVPEDHSNNQKSSTREPQKPVEEVLNNEVAQESVNNIIQHAKPIQNQAELPKSIEAKTKNAGIEPRNLSGIIALGVFAGIILLAGIVLCIVLLIRRSQARGKHERHRGSPDSHTITSVDSGSDAGLGRLYRRAWDSLAATGGPHTASSTITNDKSRRSKDTLDFRSRLSSIEGMRGDAEIIVQDALPRKHHHHHHGMHHHHHMNDSASVDWSRSVRSHRSRY